jgi:hypothetical protein
MQADRDWRSGLAGDRIVSGLKELSHASTILTLLSSHPSARRDIATACHSECLVCGSWAPLHHGPCRAERPPTSSGHHEVSSSSSTASMRVLCANAEPTFSPSVPVLHLDTTPTAPRDSKTAKPSCHLRSGGFRCWPDLRARPALDHRGQVGQPASCSGRSREGPMLMPNAGRHQV